MKKIVHTFPVKLFAVLLMLLGVSAIASAQVPSVVVVAKDGSTYSVALTKVDRIDFGAESLTVRDAGGNASEHAYADVDRLLIGELSSGIDNLSRDGNIAVWPTPFTDVVNVAGLAGGTELRLFDLRGNCVATATADGGSTVTTLVTSSLSAGVYVLACGDKKSVKIVKQ